jgi:addiction module HigA family antidote
LRAIAPSRATDSIGVSCRDTLAKKLHVPRTRIERLASETAPVTPDTALRLAKFFGTTARFWMNMQASYDLAVEGKAKKAEIDAIEQLQAA